MSTILLIEPDFKFCLKTLSLLKQEGFLNLYYAANAAESKEILKEHKPEYVFLHNKLPDAKGLDFLREVILNKVDYGYPTVIFATDDFSELPDIGSLKESFGITKVIKSPYESTDILNYIKELLKPTIISSSDNTSFSQLPAEYIQFFVDSALNFLKTMTDLEPNLGNLYFKKDPFCNGNVSAKMDVKGNLEGTVCISLEKDIAIYIVSQMLGEELETVNKDVLDGVGEIVNIIAGNTKKNFSEYGFQFLIGLPKIFTGKQFIHFYAAKIPCAVVPIKTIHGTCYIEICLRIDPPKNANEQQQ